MNKFRLLFITTFRDHKLIDYYLESIYNFNKSIPLKIILVNQTSESIKEYKSELIEIHQLYSDQTSLSHARNIAIEYIYENEIIADYVMFPDDDSTFDLLFFERFMKEVDGNTAYIIDVYESGYETLFIKNKLSQNSIISKKQYQLVCSVNMLIPFLAFTKIKFFDEDLGVGAKYGSSEDVDYFIRTLAFTNQFIYNKNLYIIIQERMINLK